jgi:transcriptional regulator with XRE-family HTH domain
MTRRERLRLLLTVAGTDQAEIARDIGISPSSLSRALAGERRLADETHRRLVASIVERVVGRVA